MKNILSPRKVLNQCWKLRQKVMNSYKSSGSVRSVPEQFRKCSGSVTKVLRISYESVPEQLVSVPEQLVSVPEQL